MSSYKQWLTRQAFAQMLRKRGVVGMARPVVAALRHRSGRYRCRCRRKIAFWKAMRIAYCLCPATTYIYATVDKT
jgi:hypothetical protein